MNLLRRLDCASGPLDDHQRRARNLFPLDLHRDGRLLHPPRLLLLLPPLRHSRCPNTRLQIPPGRIQPRRHDPRDHLGLYRFLSPPPGQTVTCEGWTVERQVEACAYDPDSEGAEVL